MSEGCVVYAGLPERAAAWFCLSLGYTYERGRDGALSDWLMDLVSVRFAKPSDLASRCGPSGQFNMQRRWCRRLWNHIEKRAL